MTETPPPLAATRQVALPGHRLLTVRPMVRRDGPALAALYAGLNHRDCYLRFFGARPPDDSFSADMASVAERGGAGIVAVLAADDAGPTGASGPAATAGGTGIREDVDAGTRTGGGGRIVAEATYEVLPNGNGELGITVSAGARGWLGPYLLDTLLEVAAQHHVPNLEADVLTINSRMLAMLGQRGMAVIGTQDCPAIVRVVVGTSGRFPSWPPRRCGPRVLVEIPGGRWRAMDPLRQLGYDVVVCPGPPGGWEACPHRRGEPCPLAAGADLLMTAVPGEAGRALVEAHRRSGIGAALCAELADDEADPGPGVRRVARGAPARTLVELVQALVPAPGRSTLEGVGRSAPE